VYTAFFSGIVVLVAGFLLYLRGGVRHQEVRAENEVIEARPRPRRRPAAGFRRT
jgi:hypothetical protein